MWDRVTARLDDRIARIVAHDPTTNVYGLARSLLALGTLLSLSFTSLDVLFLPAPGLGETPLCTGLAGSISLFCLLREHLPLAKGVAIALLLVVISGWRPRITGVLHWWVCYSLVNCSVMIDGGDHVNLVLSFLLIPITLADGRRWHWSAPSPDIAPPAHECVRRLVVQSSRAVIRLQVAVIYLHAAFAKCAVAEWQDGTALYYWLSDPQYGVAGWLQPVVFPLLKSAYVVAPLTWLVIALEFALFAGLLAKREYLPWLFWAGLTFHVGIAVLHGLVSFGLAMIGALILYLRPFNQPFASRSISARHAQATRD